MANKIKQAHAYLEVRANAERKLQIIYVIRQLITVVVIPCTQVALSNFK